MMRGSIDEDSFRKLDLISILISSCSLIRTTFSTDIVWMDIMLDSRNLDHESLSQTHSELSYSFFIVIIKSQQRISNQFSPPCFNHMGRHSEEIEYFVQNWSSWFWNEVRVGCPDTAPDGSDSHNIGLVLIPIKLNDRFINSADRIFCLHRNDDLCCLSASSIVWSIGHVLLESQFFNGLLFGVDRSHLVCSSVT